MEGVATKLLYRATLIRAFDMQYTYGIVQL